MHVGDGRWATGGSGEFGGCADDSIDRGLYEGWGAGGGPGGEEAGGDKSEEHDFFCKAFDWS